MNAARSFEDLLDLDTIVSALLLLVWGCAGYNVGREAGRPTGRSVRAGARRGLGWIALGLVLVLVRTGLVAVTATRGWDFAADRFLIVLPVLVVPAAVVVARTVPRLVVLARTRAPDRATPTRRAVRRYAAMPGLVVPVQATAVGAALGFHLTFLSPVGRPLVGHVAAAWAAWLLLVGLLHVRQTRRCARLGGLEAADLPRPARRALRGTATVAVVAAVLAGSVSWAAAASRVPGALAMHGHDHGHDAVADGHRHGGAPGAEPTVEVTSLVDRSPQAPDRRFTLVAQDTRIRLASGAVVDGHTFNGRAPGPELRMRQGELVEVTLVNAMAATDVTVHWHGIDVPNAVDGVPGVTQDAVPPGGSFVYRFRPDETGTHWYHTHQDSAAGVSAGLFGPLVVDPAAGPPPPAHEIFVAMHGWPVDGDSAPAFGTADVLDRRAVPPGTLVRLRIVVTDVLPRRFVLDGTPFRVTALDGGPVVAPTDVAERLMTLGSGGRLDVEFVMPDHPVRLTHLYDPTGGMLLSPDGTGDVTPVFDRPDFDITSYGAPAPVPFGPASAFDREYTQVFDSAPGFYDGRLTFLWTTNGRVFPDLPPIVARPGELIRVRFVNRSRFDHPMHLHGHKMLVLSRGGRPVTGSPIWLDTVDVDVGEEWEVAFVADNPGVWMDHCHNFQHAGVGMMMHLVYEGVESPFQVGRDTRNNPS